MLAYGSQEPQFAGHANQAKADRLMTLDHPSTRGVLQYPAAVALPTSYKSVPSSSGVKSRNMVSGNLLASSSSGGRETYQPTSASAGLPRTSGLTADNRHPLGSSSIANRPLDAQNDRRTGKKALGAAPSTQEISLPSAAPEKEAVGKVKTDKAKLTEQWGSPPTLIKRPDMDGSSTNGEGSRSTVLQRGELLGEGGFARVYKAIELPSGAVKALKVIAKEQLKSTKNKSKLFGEIKIHQAMVHPNIILFESCFEDSSNVYMQLNLCPNGTLLDMLRKRRRYTEAEARFYLVQLIGACDYMHTKMNVIHRDLKLGNLMLDEGMNLKVGDFGLAALVKFPGQRKKTICGTPNYIAPEILFDTTNGHSFEVDIWSIGVILYTLLVGKPPFQTKDVKEIYKKIKENNYDFPPGVDVSAEAVDLVSSILTTKPDQRPTLSEILQHSFFFTGPFPSNISTNSLASAPDYRNMSVKTSYKNFESVKKASGVSEFEVQQGVGVVETATAAFTAQQKSDFPVLDEQRANASLPSSRRTSAASKCKSGLDAVLEELEAENVEEDLQSIPGQAQQHLQKEVARGMEMEVQHVLKPSSPISDLLRSARKPLVRSPSTNNNSPRELLQRKLAAEARIASANALNASSTNSSRTSNLASVSTVNGIKADSKTPSDTNKVLLRQPLSSLKSQIAKENREGVELAESAFRSARPLKDSASSRFPARELYDQTWKALQSALEITTAAAVELLAGIDPAQIQPPKVFITSWVDYTHKYGTAYSLTDGSAGLYFNDSTTMVLSPNKENFDYISNRKGNVYSRRHYGVEAPPKELERKTYLLTYFEDYMSKTLTRDVGWTFVDLPRKRNMDFLIKYYRMKSAIVFKMSNQVLQFNFYDHTKLLLTQNGSVVTFIDSDFNMHTYSLHLLFKEAARAGYYRQGTENLDGKRADRLDHVKFLISKVTYCRDVLRSLSNRKASASATPSEPDLKGKLPSSP